MATLNSPGVSVTVIDESFYTPAAPGTTPLIVIASAENKQNSSNTGTAPGTLKANAGQVYLLSSQKDLADNFGTPVFKTDANNNPIHAGEQNEYGLQAAYSYLGVSNRAYVVRADLDLNQLTATPTAPVGAPANGTFWFDTANTIFGIFEWNSAPATTTGGQGFSVKHPTIITDVNQLVGEVTDGAPKTSFGTIGDYAIVATEATVRLWFKKSLTDSTAGVWVDVGGPEWTASWPTVVAPNDPAQATVPLANGDTLVVNGSSITGTDTIDGLVAGIMNAEISGITAAKVNGKLEIYSAGVNVVLSGTTVAKCGLESKTYLAPMVNIKPHYQIPLFKKSDFNNGTYANGRPTGSIWIKTTTPNLGADWIVKNYSTAAKAWQTLSAPMYTSSAAALLALDPKGGGVNLPLSTLYVKANDAEEFNSTSEAPYATFKIYKRAGVGATTITSKVLTANSTEYGTGSLTYRFGISATQKGTTTVPSATISIDFTGANDLANGPIFAEQLTAQLVYAGITNVIANFDVATARIVITHTEGGDIYLDDTSGVLVDSGLFQVGTTINLYNDASGMPNKYVATLWTSGLNGAGLGAVASSTAPSSIPADGQLWYNSIHDEADILIHNGTTWVGFQHSSSQYYEVTDAKGPIVSATKPTQQHNGNALVTGDLWIDTSDLEHYPKLSKYNGDTKKWVLVDTADQTTENGILFHDARWSVDGMSAKASLIGDLLVSDFLDGDAPDPALYPKGMLLWNLRRSGFNVKRFVQGAVDTQARNKRYGAGEGELQTDYYPHRWVSEAANNEDGSGTFGRHAQRKVVVQALQALVNSNQTIRDEESRVFNLLACPGYPELIGELVNLNVDRGQTAFVVGDTPARLASDATTLTNWGNNIAKALEDGDNGLVTSDEYLGVFYPWGYSSDNLGNNIVVPPSHMMLRTIALSDNVSYPWFAPAGTRRGGITNASSVGYVDAQSGEFRSVALNTGQRDTLAAIKVNPITYITGTGLVNYGQYTRAKNASALDRINVARLVVYLRRQFAQLSKPYVFEPNDKITRDELKGAAESLLLELVGQRALYDYIVVCDTSNNTPSRIDRNELYLDVAIEPVKSVEFIYIPLRLKNTGEIKALGK